MFPCPAGLSWEQRLLDQVIRRRGRGRRRPGLKDEAEETGDRVRRRHLLRGGLLALPHAGPGPT